MANSITGVNDDIISANVLSGFIAGIAPIMALATDFSGDAAKKGDKISVNWIDSKDDQRNDEITIA